MSANAVFHIEAHFYGISDISRRLGITGAVMLITLIGGRIIPSFTRNWLVRENPGRLPAPFDRFDVVAVVLSAGAFGAWTILPDSRVAGALMMIASIGQAFRLSRWAGDRTMRDPLVLILHLAYMFLPVGLTLIALSVFFPQCVPVAAGVHALGGGAIGSMTLAVMVRATLGHTGRELKAGKGTLFIFAAALLAGTCRIIGAFAPHVEVIQIAGLMWAAAFVGFAAVYGTALTRPRTR